MNVSNARRCSDDTLLVIPFGQPILVGHHSERRDRNYRGRIQSTFEKSFEASEKASYYAQKAAAAESNTAIYADDPEAVVKLREKITTAEAMQERMKTVNKHLKKKGGPDREELNKLGISDNNIDALMKPDFGGRIGYPDYALTNNNANIRRMKERLAQLEKAAQEVSKTEIVNGVEIIDSVEDNRVQIFFPGKPSDTVRVFLKSHGFRWAPSVGAWQRQRSNTAVYFATQAAEMVVAS